jgi:NDP-sugar pyrophosphorylase family protein
VVKANVVLENSVLLPGAVVEEDVEVRFSIIGPDAVIGALSRLDATCVVGANVRVEPGSRLAGDVRLGGV